MQQGLRSCQVEKIVVLGLRLVTNLNLACCGLESSPCTVVVAYEQSAHAAYVSSSDDVGDLRGSHRAFVRFCQCGKVRFEFVSEIRLEQV